ncbi:hypothetical protein MPSEU_000672200 [Mayamaea pseudoterrestris]|nr:hypothetical protein MPSEU_000672200 [Mayamaea pseudoterrestris]
MHECRLCDANSLASALASLQEVKTLRLWILRFTDDALASIFYNALAVDLTRLNQLKFLDCGPFDPGHVSSIEEELSMAALAHAIASCPRMTGMAFSLTSYPGSMDEALATCVRRKPELNHIYVGCPELPENQQPYESPLLLQALKAHYTIESVKLTHPHGLPPPRDSWDASLKENIAILLRLNAFGRKYLANDPTDRNIGLSVLEKAKDDMDCLFVHMRENPLICKREHPVNTTP